jgi:2-methylcitrate dehydratase PrpD
VIETPTYLQRLSEFAADLSFSSLPVAVTSCVKEHMLDTVGVCLAATRIDTSQMAIRLAASWGGPEESGTFGTNARFPAAAAAFVNGTLAHSLDFDDTHLPSVLHPSASIVPAALAVGEAVGATGREVIAAMVAGYEICMRTAMAAYDQSLGNSIFYERGWHATSICGTLGASVAAAKLYGLDANKIGNALGIAVSMASGVIEANRAGGSVKRLHCGWAAHAGIVAAQAARVGFSGPASAFEGRFGFYQAFCSGHFCGHELTQELGKQWAILRVFYKPYPANHFTHAAIDASLKLRNRVAIEDIDNIEVGVASPTLRTIAEPAEEKVRPRSGYHAQFSGPFAVAAAFMGGGGLGVWLDDFTDEKAADPRYIQLASKVTYMPNSECDAIFPNQFPAVLRLKTRSREVFEEKVLANRGGPENPLTADELRIKFMANSTRLISEKRALELADNILRIEDRPVRELSASCNSLSIVEKGL